MNWLAAQQGQLGARGVNLGLLLRPVQTGGGAAFVARCQQFGGAALDLQALLHHRNFGVE